MTRRWKPKRARRACIPGDDVPHNHISKRDVLPAELWHIIFSYCVPTTLFAVRDTCCMFRDIVDRDDGKLLADAPLLLPHPPPDPRWALRIYNHHGYRKAMRELFGVTDPRKPGWYGSATYTNLLFRSGRCNICHSWTPGPPEWIHSKLYFCSKSCKLMFFRSEVVFQFPQHNHIPAGSATPQVDRHLVSWLPWVSMSSDLEWRDQKRQAVLVNDLVSARKEYRDEVLSVSDAHERSVRKKAYAQRYSERRAWSRAMFMYQFYIDMWKREMDGTKRKVSRSNIHRLRRYAVKRGIPTAQAMRHPAVKRRLSTRTRDLRRVSESILTKTNLPGAKRKKRMCETCGISVSTARYDWHVLRCHPDDLPYCRLNFETGRAEYRCELCEDRPLWFAAASLRSHEYHRHGICYSEKEWQGVTV
ncbi:hypothetical protein GGF50DRAFT_42830 [Schizophyllum commune]